MSLIKCHRHTKKDLELWKEFEEADLACYDSYNMGKNIELAIECIRGFAKSSFYISVSWGKDSITVLHLCILAGVKLFTVCSRGTYSTIAHNDIYIDLVKNWFLENYPSIEYKEVTYPEYPPKSKQKSLRIFEKSFTQRHILGIRKDESIMRKNSRLIHGKSTGIVCRPIIDWNTQKVFAYCAYHKLPLHPNYGMLGNGKYERSRIRVGGSIGGEDGSGFFRREWEKEYYPDILNKIQSRKPHNAPCSLFMSH